MSKCAMCGDTGVASVIIGLDFKDGVIIRERFECDCGGKQKKEEFDQDDFEARLAEFQRENLKYSEGYDD